MTTDDIKLKIINLIRDHCTAQGITQKMAMRLLEINQPTASHLLNIEHPSLRRFSVDRLMRFCEILGIDVNVWVV